MSSQKQWTVLNQDNDFNGLVLGDGPVPKCGENDVLVKLNAASLNYRDLIIPKVCSSPYLLHTVVYHGSFPVAIGRQTSLTSIS